MISTAFRLTLYTLLISLGFSVRADSLDLVTTNLPNHGLYIDIGGRWSDYNLSELNNYLKSYQNLEIDDAGSYKIDLWYFYSSRLSCSAGLEYIDCTRKSVLSYVPPSAPGQSYNHSLRLQGYIPHFEIRYFFSMPHVDYYIGLCQMFCITKFQKRLTDQRLNGASSYLSTREFSGIGIGAALSAGMLKEITSKIKINLQTGYRYLRSGDLEYDNGIPLDYYRKNIDIDFSGAFCELTLLYKIID
jgi:hypothetical protein